MGKQHPILKFNPKYIDKPCHRLQERKWNLLARHFTSFLLNQDVFDKSWTRDWLIRNYVFKFGKETEIRHIKFCYLLNFAFCLQCIISLYFLIDALLQREIIDQLMSTGQNEDLDMITVTLVDSPDSTKSKANPVSILVK